MSHPEEAIAAILEEVQARDHDGIVLEVWMSWAQVCHQPGGACSLKPQQRIGQVPTPTDQGEESSLCRAASKFSGRGPSCRVCNHWLYTACSTFDASVGLPALTFDLGLGLMHQIVQLTV